MIKNIVIGLIAMMVLGSGLSLGESMLNNPPNIPTDPHPEDGAINIGIQTHLSWVGGDPDIGDKAVYDLYFGIESELELLVTDLQMPHYKPNILEKNTQYFWKVVARDEYQETATSEVWTFTTNDCDCNPPDQPSGPVRARNRNQYEYTTKLMIQNQNGLYYNFSWGDGNCSGWLGPYNHNERVRAEHQWQEPGEYQVQVQARFRNNAALSEEWITTGWSEPLLVTVTNEDVVNQPPDAPTITGADSGKVGIEYDYTFSSTDPDGDDIYIYVEFCANCQDNGWYGPYPSGYTLTLSHSWESKQTYQVRSMAKDVFDSESDWASLEVQMPRTIDISSSENGSSLMQRFRNRICDTFGICQGGCDLILITGTLSYDGINFYIDDKEVHFGPSWYLAITESAVDYDQDGSKELLIDELLGLVGTTVTLEGHEQSDQWVSVFTINNEDYREPGQPIWSSQHQFRFRNRNGPKKS